MPRITEKGIHTPPRNLIKDNMELFQWLSHLQLQFPKVFTYQVSINPASVNANSYSVQTFTVEGLTTTDIITVNPPALTSGLYLVSYRVSATDTLSLVFYNSTGAPIDAGAGDYLITSTRL